jgi:AraC family transcriptional regulator, regulatory protein of adaptative response / methylated-DNA-[protein]-cysteine methyltransferase
MLLDASPTEDRRWTAVLDRDAAADGRFVYAVASTRIYCRPTCPSRRPHRRHVRFFATPAAAEAEGYRACRRCRPAEREPDALRQVREARRYLDEHLDETVTLDRLGRAVGLSPWHLQRTFKRITGVTPRAYAGARRMERMKSRLKDGDSVTRATYDAGYSSPSRVYDQSRARLGMTPGAYQRGGRGVQIRFTTLPTALGQVLVAGTERGLCSVTLGDDAGAPRSSGTTTSSAGGRGRSWPGWRATRRSASRSTSGGPRSSCGYGTPCSGSRRGPPGRTPRSRGSWASRRRPARSRGRARAIRWRW